MLDIADVDSIDSNTKIIKINPNFRKSKKHKIKPSTIYPHVLTPALEVCTNLKRRFQNWCEYNTPIVADEDAMDKNPVYTYRQGQVPDCCPNCPPIIVCLLGHLVEVPKRHRKLCYT